MAQTIQTVATLAAAGYQTVQAPPGSYNHHDRNRGERPKDQIGMIYYILDVAAIAAVLTAYWIM